MHPDWYLDEPIDFELKRYLVEAFRKSTRNSFRNLSLYPSLEVLNRRLNEISVLINERSDLQKLLKSDVIGIDSEKLNLTKSDPFKDDNSIDEILQIIEFAYPILNSLKYEGGEVKEFVNKSTEMKPVGVESLYQKEGYILFSVISEREIPVYKFSSGLYDTQKQPIITFSYLKSFKKSVFETFEGIKKRILNQFTEIPHPATYAFISSYKFPLQATVLPLARIKLVEILSKS